MPTTIRQALAAATGLDLTDVDSIHVELPGAITVGDSTTALGSVIANVYSDESIPADAVLVFETDATDVDDILATPGSITTDTFDGVAGSAPSALIWGLITGVTVDGAGNAVFDQSVAATKALRLASTRTLGTLAWRAEITTIGNSASGSRNFTHAVTRLNDPRFGLSFVQAGGGLQCRVQDSSHGSTMLAAPKWDGVAMRHQRIRVSGANVVFETSPDATTWTVRASVATPSWVTANEPCRYDFSTYVAAGGVSATPVKIATAALA